MSVREALDRLTGKVRVAPTIEGLRLTERIANAIERGERPRDAEYVSAIRTLGLDRDDALMSMFGEKGMDRADGG